MTITFFLNTLFQIWLRAFVELISGNISSLSRSILLYPCRSNRTIGEQESGPKYRTKFFTPTSVSQNVK